MNKSKFNVGDRVRLVDVYYNNGNPVEGEITRIYLEEYDGIWYDVKFDEKDDQPTPTPECLQ